MTECKITSKILSYMFKEGSSQGDNRNSHSQNDDDYDIFIIENDEVFNGLVELR